jgi:hypothetical protein
MSNQRREAFFGLISPIGIDLDAVTEALPEALKLVGYSANEVRFTDLIRENEKKYDLDYDSEIERYRKFIRAGDDICRESKNKAIFALYGIASLQKYTKDRRSFLFPKMLFIYFDRSSALRKSMLLRRFTEETSCLYPAIPQRRIE